MPFVRSSRVRRWIPGHWNKERHVQALLTASYCVSQVSNGLQWNLVVGIVDVAYVGGQSACSKFSRRKTPLGTGSIAGLMERIRDCDIFMVYRSIGLRRKNNPSYQYVSTRKSSPTIQTDS